MVQRLSPGDPVPNLRLTILDADPIDLHDLRGQRIWLSLFRFAACPFCARRVQQLSIEADSIRAFGLKAFGVFPSRPDVLRRYVGKFDVPFAMVVDEEEVLYKELGVNSSALGTLKSLRRPGHLVAGLKQTGLRPSDHDGSKFRLPADFLLHPDLTVADAYYGVEADDGIPIERLQEFAAKRS